MANRLAMDKSQAIKSLAATGMSERRIARTLGVSRKAVRQHLGRGAPKETKAPTGEAPTGSGEAKDTKAPTGSGERPEPWAEKSRSLCAAYQSSILEKLEQGLTAQRIFQDLRDEQGFPGRYSSVRRYVGRLTEGTDLAFRRIEVAPGYEMQVDYGSGAPCLDEAGKFSTLHEHLASEKISSVERGAEYLLRKVRLLGTHAARWAEATLAEHGVRGMRIIQGLLALSRQYEASAIDSACEKAWRGRGFRYRIVKHLLERRAATQQTLEFLDVHPVIRPISDYAEFVRHALQQG